MICLLQVLVTENSDPQCYIREKVQDKITNENHPNCLSRFMCPCGQRVINGEFAAIDRMRQQTTQPLDD